jgi:hypothetical protein
VFNFKSVIYIGVYFHTMVILTFLPAINLEELHIFYEESIKIHCYIKNNSEITPCISSMIAIIKTLTKPVEVYYFSTLNTTKINFILQCCNIEEEAKESITYLANHTQSNNTIDEKFIDSLVVSIHTLVVEKKIPTPNFNSTTQKNKNKIKNFIHNLTQVWLKNDELLYFISKWVKL